MSAEGSLIAPSELETMPPEEIAALRDAYALGDWISHRRTPEGSSNVSFYVTTQTGRYVLRRSKAGKTEAALRFELRLIRYLRGQRFPAPEPVPARDGREYFERDGVFYLITSFIPGEPYDPDNPNHLRLAGRHLASYHQIVTGFPLDGDAHPPALLAPILSEEAMRSAPRRFEALAARCLGGEERRALAEALSLVEQQSAAVRREIAPRYEQLRKLVVHGSFGRSTVLFEGEALTGVVDYDRSTYDLRALDLAYTLKAFSRVRDKRDPAHRIGLDARRFRELLRAYLECEPLAGDELEVLPAVLTGQRLVTVPRKLAGFLAHHEIAPRREKEVKKMAANVAREAERLGWLARHGTALVAGAVAERAPRSAT